MLTIIVPGVDYYDEETQRFLTTGDVTLDLEHSLVSLSKWEQFWEVPFLSDDDKSDEQTYDYIRRMTLTPNVDPEVYTRLSSQNLSEINAYIAKKSTATWFAEDPMVVKQAKLRGKQEIVTAEVIYVWLINHSIPFECQHWHINTLLTLIKVSAQKNAPAKKDKRTTADQAAKRRALNEARKKQYKTSG